MDRLNRMAAAGVVAMAVLAVTIYVYLDAQHDNPARLDPQIVDACRSLVRESADILVQVARDNLQPDNPADASRLQDLQERVAAIEEQMAGLGCLENLDGWVYGSFRQEMTEYEGYIAELTRLNAEG